MVREEVEVGADGRDVIEIERVGRSENIFPALVTEKIRIRKLRLTGRGAIWRSTLTRFCNATVALKVTPVPVIPSCPGPLPHGRGSVRSVAESMAPAAQIS